jgi:hypothetical protein
LFLLKLISKKLSRKEGKVNTILHGQGGKDRHSTPAVKVEQLIAWPRRKKIKTQGGKNIIYFPPVEIHRYCHKKRLCPVGKIGMI